MKQQLALAFFLCSLSPLFAAQTVYQIGAAQIDITPDYPIRLSGYGNRRAESEGVKQRIFAKALAIGADQDDPAILLTVDNCAVPESLIDEVARRLAKQSGIKRERIAVSFSHTHSAPMLKGVIPFLFGLDIPPDHQEHIDRYTRELTDKMEQVALAALKDRRPARLSWGRGQAGFGVNRRTKGGPVDPDLPVLEAVGLDGKIRAILASYACHCTTVTGEFNFICGDWAGYAQEYLQRDHPGAVVLTAIGCGADQNPFPRPGFELAQKHGEEIEKNVNEVLSRTLTPIDGKLFCRSKRIALPFDTLPTREQWQELAKKPGAIGYHAQKNLERLDRGEKLPTELPYTVAAWNFGDDLAMVFLPGEVVVDYSLRLKKEFDSTRLWVNAYANDAPCYIPSRRVLKEGGYEGGGAMVYYDRPTKFAEPIEDLIIAAVHEVVPKSFLFDKKKAEFPAPKSPAEALAAFQLKKNLTIELVAAEPLVLDPVAIDFGSDGKLWVIEMRDYPAGMDGNYKPGGRVKVLESTRDDGKYDKGTVFLDNLPFPTGLMAWKKGVLVCAAPDILYAEDTDGDGKADVVKKLFTGYATHNFQARVNCLRWGLDGWVYGAAGLFGGKIHSELTGKDFELTGRDFRIRPDTGEFEAVSGLSQQGRVRDDFGNWFGCDNSTLLWQFPLPEQYVRRNPFVTPPSPRVLVPKGADINQLYPASRTLERFNQPQSANHTTSACGLEIYRDDFLGAEFYGNAFVCEPVHNLVHREVLVSDGIIFSSHRAPDELHSEFLASTDNWFRPVEVRTGPDGALWVVDMYRFVIEHPKWIPPERLAKLDPRAGEDKGRIYRIYPSGKSLRPMPNLKKLSERELIRAFDTPNGTERDLIHRELLIRGGEFAAGAAIRAIRSTEPAARVEGYWAMDALYGSVSVSPALIQKGLEDASPQVRRVAIQLSESIVSTAAREFDPLLEKMSADPDLGIRFQLALAMGSRPYVRNGETLARLARTGLTNPWMRAAVLTSSAGHESQILQALLPVPVKTQGRTEMIAELLAAAVRSHQKTTLAELLDLTIPRKQGAIESWHFSVLTTLFETDSDGGEIKRLPTEIQNRIDRLVIAARQLAATEKADENERMAAIRMLGRNDRDLPLLASLAKSDTSPRLQKSAMAALKNSHSPKVPGLLLNDWTKSPPALRASIIDLLFVREDWIAALLGAVEKQEMSPAEISPINRQRLLNHANEKIRSRAETLLSANRPQNRAVVLQKYSDVATRAGDPKNGAAIFEKNCSVCHALRGVGHAVGPDLAAWRDKSAQDFLVAIFDPNAVIEPRFINYQIETRDGRSLSGVISGETATSVTLIQPGGASEQLLRSDVAAIKASPLSLMPEGLEQSISPQDLADLISYFKN